MHTHFLFLFLPFPLPPNNCSVNGERKEKRKKMFQVLKHQAHYMFVEYFRFSSKLNQDNYIFS